MSREDLLHERISQLEAGESLEASLAGLPEDESSLLKLVAALRAVPYPDETAGAIADQRARLRRAAAGPRAIASSIRRRIAETLQRFPTWWNSLATLPRPAALLAAGAVILVILGVVLLLRQPAQVGPGVAQNPNATPAFTVHIPVVSSVMLAPDPQSAIINEARGLVEVQSSEGVWSTVQAGAVIQAGQRVRTGRLSGATLRFYDGSQVRLEPGAEVSVDELNAALAGPRVVRLTQWMGESNHDVTPSSDAASRYEVRTPSGTGVAKGTSFHVQVTPDQIARFNVDEGSVAVTSLNVTVVVVAGQSTTIYADEPPSQPVFRISGEGRLEQVGDVWRIGGRDFLVNTTPGEGRSVTEIIGDPQVGDWVSVEGRILPGGAYFADRIVLLIRAPENRFSFTGTVESIGDTEWSISGRAVRVNTDTDIDDDIESGDLVEVTGIILEDGALLAERIRRVEADGLPFEFVGIVESIGTEAWMISGVEVTVDDHTEIKDDPGVGDVVKVEGRILEDNTWLADEIKLVEEDERRFEFTGTVDQIDPWVVSGIHFDTSDATEIDDDIEVGDRVRVEGRVLDDGIWLAEEIRLLEEDDDLRRFNFVGRVRRINPWNVGGLDIAVDDQTHIDEGIEVGDRVRVRGVILPDGTLLARRIRLLDDEPGCMDIVAVIVRIDGNRIVLDDGQVFELTDDLEIEGELRASVIVIIRVCVDEDGTVVVVKIKVIFRPQPPAPTPPPPPPPGDDDDDDDGGGSVGGSFVITENDQTLTLTCNGHSVTINGNANTITLLGRCSSVTIRGNSNRVSLDSATSVTNTGNNNIIQQR